MLNQITPVILTFDEAPNIGRCLERLRWARQVVVLDSGSSDGTQAVCAGFTNVRLVTRPFDNHAAQWNHALHETGVESAWVLSLDADYILPDSVIREIEALSPGEAVDGYWLSFRYAILGRTLLSGVYPPVLALLRRGHARYVQDGHTQRAEVSGATGHLHSPAVHDDRKPLDRWVRSQLAYARLEAEKLDQPGRGGKHWLRTRTPFAPIAMGLYCLILRGGLFEGPAGWLYAGQRMLAEALILAALLDRKLRPPTAP